MQKASRIRSFLITLVLGICPCVVAQAQTELSLPDGSVYVGQTKAGRPHGTGVLRWPGGRRYEGEFRNGQAHGKGRKTAPGDEQWEGEFRSGMLNGKAEHRNAAGNHYRGQFKHDRYHGPGKLRLHNGDVYEGQFEYDYPHGSGHYTTADEDHYIGDFRYGEFTGEGKLLEKERLRYEGGFKNWRYEGQGVFYWDDNDRYEGQFRNGLFHGAGKIIYSDPAGGPESMEGVWENGSLKRDEVEQRGPALPAIDYEQVFSQQDALLERAVAALPSGGDMPRVYFVGLAGDGNQGVFQRELELAGKAVSDWFQAPVHELLISNHRDSLQEAPLASARNLEHILQAIGERMNVDRDILFLFLTSHGARDHSLVSNLGRISLSAPDKDNLPDMLDKAGIRWRIIVISACFSGGFIAPLASPESIVLTASSDDHVSFGCSDENEFTYFGEALLAHALPRSSNLRSAMKLAIKRIKERESEAGYSHSQPQSHFGSKIRRRLDQLQGLANR